jgi:hypothetical protein
MIYPYLFRVPENQGILITSMSESLYETLGKQQRTTFILQAHLRYPGKTVRRGPGAGSLTYTGPTFKTTYTYCRTYDWECTSCSDLRGRATWTPDPYVHSQDGSYTRPHPHCSCPLQQPRLCTAILSTCREICAEATPCLYRQHTFDFGEQFEAGTAFLRDRSPYSVSALRSISVQIPVAGVGKRLPAWHDFCVAMAKCSRVEKLELTVKIEHRVPSMDGIAPLNESSVKKLFDRHHSMMDWVDALSEVRGVKELTVLPLLPTVRSSVAESSRQMTEFWRHNKTLGCMSMPESVEGGLARFLRKQLGITS